MINIKFTAWPLYSMEESGAVLGALFSNKVNYWTGSECREFEKDFLVWSGST